MFFQQLALACHCSFLGILHKFNHLCLKVHHLTSFTTQMESHHKFMVELLGTSVLVILLGQLIVLGLSIYAVMKKHQDRENIYVFMNIFFLFHISLSYLLFPHKKFPQ